MTTKLQRIGVLGAASLMGRELADELGESTLATSQVNLLDDGESVGQLTSAGEEATLIQPVDATSFDGLDFAFFAGSQESTKAHWQRARKSGAAIVDLTYALDGEPGVLVRAPWLRATAAGQNGAVKSAAGEPDLNTTAVVAAHPAALMLALIAARLKARMEVTLLAATVMEPASEFGRAAMDELHQQTVSLLSFKDLPKEQYDTQVAFNLLTAFGEEAKAPLSRTADLVERHYGLIGGGALPELDLQVVHAPVFHGHTASVLVELASPAKLEDVERALAGEHVDLIGDDSDPLSNLTAAGQRSVLVRARSGGKAGTRFWLWLATDNLKLAAANAIACAVELRRLRPQGKVQ